MMLHVFFLGLVALCAAQRTALSSIAGKVVLSADTNLAMLAGGEASRTFYLPSNSGTTAADISAGTRNVTLLGTNFNDAEVITFCLATAGGCAAGCDPTFRAATLVRISDVEAQLVLPTGPAAASPRNWNDVTLELEEQGYRQLCVAGANAGNNDVRFTGINIGATWDCSADPALDRDCNRFFEAIQTDVFAAANPHQRAMFSARSSCCQSNLGLNVGVCRNPNLQGCCNGIVYSPTTHKCCNPAQGWIQTHEQPCLCRPANAAAGIGNDCGHALENTCCTQSKFPEFAGIAPAINPCYNPLTTKCCNTGELYDAGSSQCCAITGIQSLNIPCPCQNDGHCTNEASLCCRQTAPPLREVEGCSIYNNYPTGQGFFDAERCEGVCFDPRYQICCNGAVCRGEFEKCCNATCCNRHVGTCTTGIREGSVGHPINKLEYDVVYNTCTEIEALGPVRAFFVFVLPAALLFATLACLALVLVFANKASVRKFTTLERAIVFLSILTAILACALYFSPLYKYGAILVFASLLCIITASIRNRSINLAAVIILFIVLLYLIDPFTGNALGGLSAYKNNDGSPDMSSAGILHSIGKIWHQLDSNHRASDPRYEQFDRHNVIDREARIPRFDMRDATHCTRFYHGYFRLDPVLMDTDRADNPLSVTFGYCARPWVIALLIIAGLLMILALILFILALLALILRFRRQQYEPIELEVVGAPPTMM